MPLLEQISDGFPQACIPLVLRQAQHERVVLTRWDVPFALSLSKGEHIGSRQLKTTLGRPALDIELLGQRGKEEARRTADRFGRMSLPGQIAGQKRLPRAPSSGLTVGRA